MMRAAVGFFDASIEYIIQIPENPTPRGLSLETPTLIVKLTEDDFAGDE